MSVLDIVAEFLEEESGGTPSRRALDRQREIYYSFTHQ
jgi:hypothetical protein